MKPWKKELLIAIAAIVLMLIIGQMDYGDTIRERDYYCRMVKNHAWPDYRHIYQKECKNAR